MVETLYRDIITERPKRPDFAQLRQLWLDNKDDFRYENILQGNEFGLPPIEDLETRYARSVREIDGLFFIEDQDVLEEAGDNSEGFISATKITPRSSTYRRDAIRPLIEGVQITLSRLIYPLDCLNRIIGLPARATTDRVDVAAVADTDESPTTATELSKKLSPLEQTHNRLRYFWLTLIEHKKQLVMYSEGSLNIRKTIERGGGDGVKRALRSVLESANIFPDIMDFHSRAMKDVVLPTSSDQDDSDERSLSPRERALFEEEQRKYKQRTDKYQSLLAGHAGIPNQILVHEGFQTQATELWNMFSSFERYDFIQAVYSYLKFLENKRSDFAFLLNEIDPPLAPPVEKPITLVKAKAKATAMSPERPKLKIDKEDIATVRSLFHSVSDEIKRISPLVALLSQKGFLKQHKDQRGDPQKDKWANLSKEFEKFEDTLFPTFEYILEKTSVGDSSYPALKNTKTGTVHALLDETPGEAASRLGGRLVVMRRKKKTRESL